jgi:Ohr subfamily peroxiredoxin
MAGPNTVLYTTEGISKGGGRAGGNVRLAEGGPAFFLQLPKEMGGPGEGSNPEQFFALGYAACFNGAVGLVARQKTLDVSRAEIHVKVSIGPEATSFALAVEIQMKCPGLSEAQVKDLLEAAHEVCPYSKATRGNVPVTLKAL